MTEVLFSDAKMKLSRARMFIGELKCELDRYRGDEPFTASWAFDQNPPAVRIDYKAITDLPGAIVGDAIHNLRTALDLMASELVRLAGESDNNVYFPFGYDAPGLESEIKKKNFQKAGQDAVDLLWKYAPHRGGNEALRALHDLDIRDKHKSLVLMGSNMSLTVSGSYNVETLEADAPPVVEGDLQYIFPEPPAFKGKPVIATLEELLGLVSEIIEEFAKMVSLRPLPNNNSHC